MDDLKDRVAKFNLLQLPGQPMGMHMGTSYLVNDLWREIDRLRAENAALKMQLAEPPYRKEFLRDDKKDTCLYLNNGEKVVLKRHGERAWLVIEKQDTIHIT